MDLRRHASASTYRLVYILDKSYLFYILYKQMALFEYRIRFDGIRELDDRAIAFFKKRSDGYILVHHVTQTENPHYHAYVRTAVSQGNFSNYLKKEFGVSKSDYSNKTCSTDRRLEFWAYLFNSKKGNVATLVDYQGISPLEVKMAQDTSKQLTVEYEQRIKNLKDKDKMTKFDIAEKLSTEKFANHGDLYDAVIKLLHANRMCTNMFVIKDIMSTTLSINGDPTMKAGIIKYFTIDRLNAT